MSMIKKPVFWVGVTAVAAVGYFATMPEQNTAPTTKKLTFAKKPTTKGATVFTDEDKNATFPRVSSGLKNSFQPIVMRKGGGLGSGEGKANEIPADFTGGDTGWVYTGSAEIDGQMTALIENRSASTGVFLKSGERWKSAVVIKIAPNFVVLSGPSGVKTFSLVDESVSSQNYASATMPVEPARVGNARELRGQIGRNGSNDFNIQAVPDVTVPGRNDFDVQRFGVDEEQ